MRLAGLTALITGAGSGIGRAMAVKFAAEGAEVMCLDINAETAGQTAASIISQGGKAGYARVNVASPGDVAEAVREALSAFGKIDTLVNSAGVLKDTPLDDITEEEWDRVLSINLKGVFLICQAAMPSLRASPCASVINIASNAGRDGGVSAGLAYSASKAGVIGFTRGLAKREAKNSVTCNAIAPGTTNSDMLKSFTPDNIVAMQRAMPLGRFGEPEDIAELAVFVASPSARFMTGAVLDINGGLFIG